MFPDPCADCARLVRRADDLDIHDSPSSKHRTRLMLDARAGDCPFAPSCHTRRSCHIAPQNFQIRPSANYFKPQSFHCAPVLRAMHSPPKLVPCHTLINLPIINPTESERKVKTFAF